MFFADDVNPNDILQGFVAGSGNCYLMSAIANLAKNPNRIKKIFGNKEISNEGIYYVKLFYKGAFKEIVIDDFIPVGSYNTPLFARAPLGSGEIWVQLIEKSYAKLFGSFTSMTSNLLHNSRWTSKWSLLCPDWGSNFQLQFSELQSLIIKILGCNYGCF